MTAPHETSVSATVEWITPSWVFRALGVAFDLDPCAPLFDHPARKWCARRYTLPDDDGLINGWDGYCFLNPPYGPGIERWLSRAAEHGQQGGNVIALLPVRPDTGWFQDGVLATVTALLWHRGRIAFQRPDGTTGNAPGVGSVLVAWGQRAAGDLIGSGLVGARWYLR